MTNSEQSTLFRESALKEMNDVQVLQSQLRIVETKSVAYLLLALLALLSMVLWVFFGTIEMEVPTHGIILSGQDIAAAEKVYRDYRSEQKKSLQSLKYLLAKKQSLYAKHYITIIDLENAKQEYLKAQENIANIPKLNIQHNNGLFSSSDKPQENFNALVFVGHTQGKNMTPGMPVYLLPTFLSAYEYGYIRGKVVEVSDYPASKEAVYTYLGNMNLVDEYFVNGAPFVIRIEMEKNLNNPSGLNWTSKQGAPFKISAGSDVSGKIISHQYHPYELLTRHFTR